MAEVLSGSAIASIFTATLRISQAVYELKAVGEQTRDLLETTKHIDESAAAVRRIRRQKSSLLNETEKAWIDAVLKNTEVAVGSVAKMIEPARVDMDTRTGQTTDITFWHRTLFVLRDSPRVAVNLTKLSVATQGLYAAMTILCSREGHGVVGVESNLNVPSRGGTVRRRASSPGRQPQPPPYDYQEFLNRNRRSFSSVEKKVRSVQPKASKVSFMIGDDDTTLVDEERGEGRSDKRAPSPRWIEPEDILNPDARAFGEFHPYTQLQNATVDMVRLVAPQPIDQSPACVPEPALPGPGEDWNEEAVRQFRIRQEISNRMLRHERTIQDLRARLTDPFPPSARPSGLGISAEMNSSQTSLVTTASFKSFTPYDDIAQLQRPRSSQSIPPIPSQPGRTEFGQAGAGTPPPVPQRPPSGNPRTPSNLVPQISLPYPDARSYDNAPRTSSSKSQHETGKWTSSSTQYGTGNSATPNNPFSPTQMPEPISSQTPTNSPQSVSVQNRTHRAQSLSPQAMPSPPPTYSPLTHFNTAPAGAQYQGGSMAELPQYVSQPTPQPGSNVAHFPPYGSQSPPQHYRPPMQMPSYLPSPPQADMGGAQSILQPAYSHLTKNYSIQDAQPEEMAEPSRGRFSTLFGRSKSDESHSSLPEPVSSEAGVTSGPFSAGHHRNLSHSSSVSSVHSYEPFDPTTVKRLPPLPTAAPWASMSSLNLGSADGGSREPTVYEFAATTPPPREGFGFGRPASVSAPASPPAYRGTGEVGGGASQRSNSVGTTSSSARSRGRLGLEYRMSVVDEEGQGGRSGHS